ncbi:inositol-pentakisphosphate 2-kinase [Lampris incognitus]|uniref:inositol-pentakisphosphate 2-kinase n=1 Tax=Lampris incognitus TaxID=2546036 RepID=UPI0024B5AAD0|nr:inositol-pentakisphosphate 2-kinase [Lampris incognitus]
MELDKMDESDWKYHGEGNKSLVVSHVQHSRVLRLLKYSADDSENPPQSPEQAFRQIQNIADFSNNVMSIVLGAKFIHSGEVVKLPLEFVRQLSIKVQHQRPEWRCNKVMDIYSGYALCLPNLTSPPVQHLSHTPPLCIEIKPKCGFLPSSRNVSKDIKTKMCRFCMHQHYKVANGRWKRPSLYCPLDLFSGNKQRMYLAIRHLMDEPQNNFKIFKGGECIYGGKEDSEDLVDLSSLLLHLRPYFQYGTSRINAHLTNKALLNNFIQVVVNALLSSGGQAEGEGKRALLLPEGRSICEASLLSRELIRSGPQGLPRDSVLGRILQTQMLDSLDIEGLFPLYRRVEQHLLHYPKERGHFQTDGPYNQAFLDKLQSCPAEDDGSIDYAVTKVHQYRVAMTAKDCSIMVALVPCSEEEDDEGLSSQEFHSSRPPGVSFSVSILDLDPKPWDSIPQQHRLDQKIVSYYLRTRGALPKDSMPPCQSLYTAVDREREDCMLLFHPV